VAGCSKQSAGPVAKPSSNDETYPYDVANYVGATLPAGDTIKSFSTTWIVPSSPPTDSTIFWWNALDRGACQPVLQWEHGTWAISNWCYVQNVYHQGKILPVSAGTVLTGVIQLVSYKKGAYTYKESFVGYPDADLTFTRPTVATGLAECMEPYLRSYMDLSPDTLIRMTNIDCVLTNGKHPPALQWISNFTQNITPAGFKPNVVVSPNSTNGEVDFYMK
jgi:hypothetical protein